MKILTQRMNKYSTLKFDHTRLASQLTNKVDQHKKIILDYENNIMGQKQKLILQYGVVREAEKISLLQATFNQSELNVRKIS